MSYSVSPVGIIHTPFKQKFAIPRQPNLVSVPGTIVMQPGFDDPAVFKGIEGFSHLWLLFVFHETLSRGWKPAVKAPRLGGNATLGVFASRSTHRPNGIGMSVVKRESIENTDGRLCLKVSGVDLLDGTPILDIKPYLPYADGCADATDPLDNYTPIPNREVRFVPALATQLAKIESRVPGFTRLTDGILRQDPRPAYRQPHDNDKKIYKVSVYDYDISWHVTEGVIEVTKIEDLPHLTC